MHVFACDYDRTIADGGRCSPEVAAALGRVRESGRKILLVTGRMLSDLRSVCADVDRMFDAVVAENGAVLYFPETREATTLGDAPESALVEELRRRGVPFDRGSSIIATTEGYAEAALAAVRETGVERTLVFNKGALMLVPGGVTKGTGLEAALTVLALSPHNMVGSGDAAYDHALLAFAELQRVVVLGGSSERVLPTPDELRQLLHQPRTSLVLNLSAMTRAEKVAYATKALGAVAFVRSTTGLPHWLILDEAHHIAPADGSPVAELLRGSTESLCLSRRGPGTSGSTTTRRGRASRSRTTSSPARSPPWRPPTCRPPSRAAARSTRSARVMRSEAASEPRPATCRRAGRERWDGGACRHPSSP